MSETAGTRARVIKNGPRKNRSSITGSINDKIFDFINYLLLVIVLGIVIMPLLFVIAASVSEPSAVVTGEVWFWPVGFHLEAYKQIFRTGDIMLGYRNTITYTLVGTCINLILTICAAYPLSRKDFAGRGFFILFMVFTMYFNGGMIPSFLNIQKLHMIDTIWAMVLPTGISTMSVIIMRTFFQTTIPAELHESALIDGASNIHTLLAIVLPLSKPVIAVLLLQYAVGHWNSYMGGLLYITTWSKRPLQIVLREILILRVSMEERVGMTKEDLASYAEQLKRGELLKYAIIIVANLPVLMIYPLIQKYFVKGIMIGSVKG